MFILLAGSGIAGSISQLITVFIIFIFVLAITVFATRFVGGYQKLNGMNKNLEVIETTRITNNKFLQIIRAGEKYFVIGVGKDEISMLVEIDKETLIDTSTDKISLKESFSDILAGKSLFKGNDKDKSDNNE